MGGTGSHNCLVSHLHTKEITLPNHKTQRQVEWSRYSESKYSKFPHDHVHSYNTAQGGKLGKLAKPRAPPGGMCGHRSTQLLRSERRGTLKKRFIHGIQLFPRNTKSLFSFFVTKLTRCLIKRGCSKTGRSPFNSGTEIERPPRILQA